MQRAHEPPAHRRRSSRALLPRLRRGWIFVRDQNPDRCRMVVARIRSGTKDPPRRRRGRGVCCEHRAVGRQPARPSTAIGSWCARDDCPPASRAFSHTMPTIGLCRTASMRRLQCPRSPRRCPSFRYVDPRESSISRARNTLKVSPMCPVYFVTHVPGLYPDHRPPTTDHRSPTTDHRSPTTGTSLASFR